MINTLFILCEDASIDSKTNQWSFFKHIEKINLSIPKDQRKEGQGISVKGKFNLVSFFEADGQEEAEIKYLFVDENGDVLMETPGYKIASQEGKFSPKHRLILNQIPIKESGRYFFKLYKKENDGYKEVSEIGIDVSLKVKEEE